MRRLCLRNVFFAKGKPSFFWMAISLEVQSLHNRATYHFPRIYMMSMKNSISVNIILSLLVPIVFYNPNRASVNISTPKKIHANAKLLCPPECGFWGNYRDLSERRPFWGNNFTPCEIRVLSRLFWLIIALKRTFRA